MNISFKQFKNDNTFLLGYLSSISLLVISVSYILLLYSQIPPYLPIFNQMPWGDMRIGAKNTIFLPIGITTFVCIINFFLSAYLYEKLPLVSRIFAVVSLLICIFTLLFSIRTLQLMI